MPTIRPLTPSDAAAFQVLRLRGLLECPGAFASSWEEEVDTPIDVVASRLSNTPGGVIFGLHDGDALAGVVGIQRESMRKLAHRAHLWGMYVAPEARRRGVGRSLVVHALDHAARSMGVRRVHLGVNTTNVAAVALYRGAGFVVTGTEREFIEVDGVAHDEYTMTWVAPAQAGPAADDRAGGGAAAARPVRISTPRTCTGSCHCGAVRFEIDTDFPELTMCDCSICRRKNALMVKVHESAFRLLAGTDALAEYRFHTRTARHFFCRICGIYPFHRKRVTPDFVGVNVHCLHDVDLEGIPVRRAIGAAMT